MGMDISSMTIVGLPYDEFKEKYSKGDDDLEEKFEEMVNDGELDSCSPSYDSSPEDWYVGISISDCGISVSDFIKEVEKANKEFIELFGFEPNVYSSPHVY